ncbi:MAG: hypothetical protein M1835_004469 [Candelina submexicana]|nr:MAG: hypothetical protein M1835_004469 [Candelina submexicana]
MPGRLPAASDFASWLQLAIIPPPASQAPTNILLLFHGLGDTNSSFTSLGQNLSLPETACISLQAPTPLPFDLGGYHWGDDIIFDQTSGKMDVDTGFEKVKKVIGDEVIQKGLVGQCGYQTREIFMLGFGQGGMAALAAAASLSSSASLELGGVVSIGGPLPSTIDAASKTAKTPILILGGSSNSLITASNVTRLKGVFESVQYKQWSKAGDGMPSNPEQMLPIMQFFASRLRSRKGVPEGSVEVG